MTAPTTGIEGAFRRVATLGDSIDGGNANVLSGSRRVILEALRSAQEPLSVEAIAEHTGLHVNTTRHHLDVLAAADLVERSVATPTGRGRPKIMYSVSRAALAPFAELGEFLENALEGGDADTVAVEAARRWLSSVPHAGAADDPDEAVAAAVESLRVVGFDARTDAIGDSIVVTDCPYASLIAEHPMICTVHAELVAGVLRRTGQDVTLAGFDVWVRPGTCRARLTRPDTAPSFTAEPSAPNPAKKDRS